ncbi:hypothetical protein PN498_01870 [Oscillatoria sp. CS-180]|nr:hypothetical protein [Oscillatoria sp. CS-180]MDB9524723.1 hypothetical protein [Oscillatoria sp. CS-180]
MSSSSPLTGPVLVDCAKANAHDGAVLAAQRCGYGNDVEAFQSALKSACADMGVDIKDISDLITDQQQVKTMGGTEIAPDTPSDL